MASDDTHCLGCGFKGLLFDSEDCPRCGKAFSEKEFDAILNERFQASDPGAGIAYSRYEKFQVCGPLHDPVKHWSIITIITFTLNFLFLPVSMIWNGAGMRSSDLVPMIALGMTLAIVQTVLIYLAYRPLHQIAFKRKRVIFLRAFHRDIRQDDLELRTLLRAALPGEFNLSGIRAPRLRSNPLLSQIGGFVKAFQYVGSDAFELEAADNNWLARLLATLSESHAMILDARTLTKHVGAEIKLACLLSVDAPNRVFVLVDLDDRSEEEMRRELFSAADDLPEDFPACLTFVRIPSNLSEHEASNASRLRASFNGIPQRTLRVSKAGMKFVEDQVPEERWSTHLWQKAGFYSFFGILLNLYFLVFEPVLSRALALGIGLISLIYLAFAGTRLWKSAKRQIALGGSPIPSLNTMIVSRLTFVLGPIVMIVTLAAFIGVASLLT